MLTFEQIKELIELVADHRLSGIELERSGFRLKVDGETRVQSPAVVAPSADGVQVAVSPPVVAAPPVAAAAAPAAEVAKAAATSGDGEAAELPDNVQIVKSPIVGTFYAAPDPDSPPFVRAGDQVTVGQVLCIVEAMKLMNEIESDVTGVVLKVYPKNAQPVEYGEPLFAIEPD